MRFLVDENDVIYNYVKRGNVNGEIEVLDDTIPEDFELNKYKYITGVGFLINENYNEDKIKSLRTKKLTEISNKCTELLKKGIDFDGHHYSATLEDQVNVEALKNVIQAGAKSVMYHADGELCREFTAQEFLSLYKEIFIYKNTQLTYRNILGYYILQLTTEDDINSVEYGQELTGEYLKLYNESLEKNMSMLSLE